MRDELLREGCEDQGGGYVEWYFGCALVINKKNWMARRSSKGRTMMMEIRRENSVLGFGCARRCSVGMSMRDWLDCIFVISGGEVDGLIEGGE